MEDNVFFHSTYFGVLHCSIYRNLQGFREHKISNQQTNAKQSDGHVLFRACMMLNYAV